MKRNRVWGFSLTGLVTVLALGAPLFSSPADRATGALQRRNLAADREWRLRTANAVLEQRLGISIDDTLQRLPRLPASDLRKEMARYAEFADSMNRRGPSYPVGLYVLPCAAYERLVEAVGIQNIGAMERLRYARWLSKDTNPLLGAKAAEACRHVLTAQPNPDQELEALRALHRALMLADQIAVGENAEELIQVLDALRARYPTSVELKEVLVNTGDYFVRNRDKDRARPYYQEALSSFRASYPAALRLREIDN